MCYIVINQVITEDKKYIFMGDDQAILAYLEKINLTRGMLTAELKALAESSSICRYDSHTLVIAQNEISSDIYVIMEGRVELTICDEENHEIFKLTELGPEDTFGEIAFRDNLPRSCTVTTLEKTTLIKISKNELITHGHIGNDAHERLILNTAAGLSRHIRTMNESYIAELKQKITILNNMLQFSRMFVYVTVMIGLSSVLLKYLAEYGQNIPIRSKFFSWVYLLFLFIPCLYLTSTVDKPLSTFGVTLKNAKQNIIEAVLIIVIVAPGLIYYAGYEPVTLISHFLSPFSLVYFLHSAIQEFVARGVIQTTISNFVFDHANITSIFLASFYFAIFHLHIGLSAFMLTFVVGLLFGYLYYRQKSLIGVTLVHYVLGWIALKSII